MKKVLFTKVVTIVFSDLILRLEPFLSVGPSLTDPLGLPCDHSDAGDDPRDGSGRSGPTLYT